MNNDILNSIKIILEKHLSKDKYKFFLYGSRARWNYTFRSDYDIWILWEKLDYKTKSDINNDIEENVPALVSINDFASVSEDFKKLTMKDIIYL